jgi:chemotaxis protein methyltransferase CheR
MSVQTQNVLGASKELDDSRDPIYLRIRDLVYQTCGIYHAEDKLYLLAGACKRRMAEAKARGPKEYFDVLTALSTRDAEVRQLLNEITIGETCLFRSQGQLDALKNVLLPKLTEERNKLGLRKLRIWSAGCSTGEEPYTLAMFFAEERERKYPEWTFEILATDLNDRSLETARAGVYGNYALRNTPELYKKKYFVPAEEGKLRIKDELKARIAFSRLNLNDDARVLFMRNLDVILCCNVLIYFDQASKRRVVQHFYSGLLPGGYFFLGHAESLYQVNEQFRLIHLPGTTVYWKAIEGAEAGKK